MKKIKERVYKKYILGILYFLNVVLCIVMMFLGIVEGEPTDMITGVLAMTVFGILIAKNEQGPLVNIYKKINEY